MSSPLRAVKRTKDDNLRKSWNTWLALAKGLPLGQRLTIAYKIVPGLRYAAQLCVVLGIAVVMLPVALVQTGMFQSLFEK